MKRYFCDELNNVLSCFHDKIMSCCSGQIGPVYYDEYKGQKIDWDAFKRVKTDAFDLLNEDDIDKSPCKGCYYLRERKDTDIVSPTFKTINISHWTHCNCGCIYCARMYHSKGRIDTKVKKSDYYDIVPILKQLYKNNLLDRENLFATIQGGDISILKELKPMFKEFLKNGVKEFYILSNNIVYQPIVKELLDKNIATYTTSLDCASPELYYKIKRVDKFKDAVQNLRKYDLNRNSDKIVVKYIIIEHINDNIEEITKFVNLMFDIGIRNIEFMIDNKYVLFMDLDKIPLPSHYGQLYLHMKNLCNEKGIRLVVWSRVENIINKYALKICN